MSIREATRPYARPDIGLALFHLLLSLAIWLVALTLGAWAWGAGNWALVALCCLLMFTGQGRLFGVQHDCGHLTYFPRRRVNEWVGVALGALTFNPYFAMRYNHNRHHAHIGNLDRMEAHEVLTWTVAEWRAASPAARLFYRAYRSIPVICLLGPLFVIFIRYRVPKNAVRTGLADILLQNGLMLATWAAIYAGFGPDGMWFYALAVCFSACAGVLMVYVGHNHEETYWERGEAVSFDEASLKGSCVIDGGPVFDFMTFNFAYHDLHHFNARIPAYHLKRCHVALADRLAPRRLSLREAVACLQWKLWDEDKGRMVRFSDARGPDPALERTA